jgi:hypothetical protein
MTPSKGSPSFCSCSGQPHQQLPSLLCAEASKLHQQQRHSQSLLWVPAALALLQQACQLGRLLLVLLVLLVLLGLLLVLVLLLPVLSVGRRSTNRRFVLNLLTTLILVWCERSIAAQGPLSWVMMRWVVNTVQLRSVGVWGHGGVSDTFQARVLWICSADVQSGDARACAACTDTDKTAPARLFGLAQGPGLLLVVAVYICPALSSLALFLPLQVTAVLNSLMSRAVCVVSYTHVSLSAVSCMQPINYIEPELLAQWGFFTASKDDGFHALHYACAGHRVGEFVFLFITG